MYYTSLGVKTYRNRTYSYYSSGSEYVVFESLFGNSYNKLAYHATLVFVIVIASKCPLLGMAFDTRLVQPPMIDVIAVIEGGTQIQDRRFQIMYIR